MGLGLELLNSEPLPARRSQHTGGGDVPSGTSPVARSVVKVKATQCSGPKWHENTSEKVARCGDENTSEIFDLAAGSCNPTLGPSAAARAK